MVEHVASLPPSKLVLYDGVCAICNRTVQWLLQVDRLARLRFAPLRGTTADELRRRHPEIPRDLDSIIYVEASDGEEHVSWNSEALFRIYADLGLQSRLVSSARWLPRWCTDVAYRAFARMRYQLFGKLDACPLPPPEVRQRFLP